MAMNVRTVVLLLTLRDLYYKITTNYNKETVDVVLCIIVLVVSKLVYICIIMHLDMYIHYASRNE